MDGCYVIKSNIIESENLTDKQIHDRYKDLKYVEWSFRTIKTTLLENRPIYCRLEEATKAVCFISMLAYKVIRKIVNLLDGHDDELSNIMIDTNPGITKNQKLTIDDLISELDMIQETIVEIEEIKIPAIQSIRSEGSQERPGAPKKRPGAPLLFFCLKAAA
ncbi:MAG: hypothetical protein HQL02_11090 [Nitrospirae bacterium]|nr:hypothetical protein [Nitrospirota bacterium]